MTIERVEYSDLKTDDRVLLEMNKSKYAEFIVIEVALPYIKWEIAHNGTETWDKVTTLKENNVKLIGRICSEQK